MADTDKKEELKGTEINQREASPIQERNFQNKPEARENLSDKERIAEQLRREVELMKLDETTQKEAEKKAEKISFLSEDDKIENLLELARKNGVIYAIKVAQKMNEPYLLDILHDVLAKEGFYKNLKLP